MCGTEGGATRAHAVLVWNRMGGGNRVDSRWQRFRGPRSHEQSPVMECGHSGHECARHRQSRFADGEEVDGGRRRVGENAPGERPVHEQGRIGRGNRGPDDLPEIGAKCRERNGQWAFAGSDQADNPVSTSISRRRRLTTCSPFCCAQR